VFAFARALARGYAFITRPTGGQHTAHFIGYENNLAIDPGTIQLDATADIDGITQLCPWRIAQPVPAARYDNLQVVSVPSLLPKNQRIRNYLRLPKNRRAYADWMADVIKVHMEPGQRGLVICKLGLIEQEAVPSEWDLDGRKLSVAHWGTGIGSNAWQDAEVVFLFDEFFIPRGVSIATAQGLLGANAMQGPLKALKGYNSRHDAVDLLWEGHLLRWLKQMALRGRGRQFDEHGVCGVQKLVTSADRTRLLSKWDRLFPGAKLTMVNPPEADGHSTLAQTLLATLSRHGSNGGGSATAVITTQHLSKQLGKPWREIAHHLKDDVWRSIENLGWRYVPVAGRPRKGQLGSRFERAVVQPPMPPVRTPAQPAETMAHVAALQRRPELARAVPSSPWDF
jgi:hypothetical protein